MPCHPSSQSYILISPVKDEEKHVETTLRSVTAQTVKPVEWIIVDDGSTDRTPAILREYAGRFDWIRVVRLETAASRQPGTAVIHAFNKGFEAVRTAEAAFVVKLDCDVRLPADYFASLLDRFAMDPQLGIASGVYLEKSGAGWEAVRMPRYHAAGACKMIRAECFREIDGFVESAGWDTVDEIRAQVLGWKTAHFEEIRFFHLKPEGSGIGSLATGVMHGRVYYLTGGAKLFFLLKVLHRMVAERPRIAGGLALLWGYLRAALSGHRRLVTRTEARYYARRLNRRIWSDVEFWRRPSQQGGSCD